MTLEAVELPSTRPNYVADHLTSAQGPLLAAGSSSGTVDFFDLTQSRGGGRLRKGTRQDCEVPLRKSSGQRRFVSLIQTDLDLQIKWIFD